MREVDCSNKQVGPWQAVLSIACLKIFHPSALHVDIKDHGNIKITLTFIPVFLPGMHRSDQLFSQPPDRFHQVSGHAGLQLLHLSSFEAHLPTNR